LRAFIMASDSPILVSSSSSSIPVAPSWSVGHPWNASFHFSFLILHSRQDSLDGGSARRKASTYTRQHKHRINAHRHPYLEWDSNPRFQCSSGRRHFMPKTARALRSPVLFVTVSCFPGNKANWAWN
jgi:hypothetical protein